MPQAKRFSSIEDFYSANEERRRSGEADYGVWWTEPGVVGNWRVSYVRATGEVYAVHFRSGGEVEVLGIVPPDPDEWKQMRTEYRVSGIGVANKGRYYETLDRILEGWADRCGSPGSLSWVREQLRFFLVN